MSSCDPEKFVNREKELAAVKDKVSLLSKGAPLAPHERVIHFIGPSGIGKSCLLEKIYAILTKEPACIPILIKMETLKSNSKELVDEFLVKVYQEFCDFQKITANMILEEPSGTLKSYSSMIVRAINLSAVEKVPVFLLDEIGVVEKMDLQKIEEHLLEILLQDNKRVVLITAGRTPPMLNTFNLRSNSKNTFLLPVFDAKTTGEQLEVLRHGSANLAAKVQALGGGVPGNNTKLVGYAVDEPPSISDELHAVQSLLANMKEEIDKRFHPLIETISILRTWYPEDLVPLFETHPLLPGQLDEVRIRAALTELKQIQIGPGDLFNWDREKKSWVMDESARALFERELQMRDSELWRKLHCTAYQMYKQWGDEYNSQLYKEKAKYHWKRLQSAGFTCDDVEVTIES